MTGRFAVLVTMVACSLLSNITNIVISRLTISHEVLKESLSVKRRFSPQRRLAENPEILGSDACHYKASRSPTRRHSLTLFSGGGVAVSFPQTNCVKVRSHEWEGGRGKLLPQSIGLACGGELGQLQPIHAVGAQGRSVSSTTESRPWDPFLYVFFSSSSAGYCVLLGRVSCRVW